MLEIRTDGSVSSAYAKCFFIHPDEETSFSGRAQLDPAVQHSLLGMASSLAPQTPVYVSRVEGNVSLATSLSIERVQRTTELDESQQKAIDTHWLGLMIEDRLLWRGAFVAVPVQGKMSLFRVVSVEPAPVALGTLLTSIEIIGEDGKASAEIPATSSLFGYTLRIQFRRGLDDFDTLATALSERGFTREDIPRSVGVAVPAGVDPDLLRLPRRDSIKLPYPTLIRGSMIVTHLEGGLMIGHFRGERGPFGRSSEFIQDLEQGIPLVQEALEKYLRLDLSEDGGAVESMTFDVFYEVTTGRDSRGVLKSLSALPDVPELAQLVGRKDEGGRLILYPKTRDRSLYPLGLLQLSIGAMNVTGGRAGYDVRFSYGLADLASAVRLAYSGARNSVSILRALEASAAP